MAKKQAVYSVGVKFGRLTLMHEVYRDDGKQQGWMCMCDCGTERHIKSTGALGKGRSNSCGCLRREVLQNDNPMFKEENKQKIREFAKNNPASAEQIAKRAIAAQSPEVKARRAKTNQERYGGNAPACSSAVMEKVAETNKDRYGGSSPMSSKAVRDKVAATVSKNNVKLTKNTQKLKSKADAEEEEDWFYNGKLEDLF